MGPDRPAEVLTLGLVATVAPYHAACSICGAMPIRITLDLTASWADTWNATQVAGLVFFILLSDNFHDLSAYQPERAGASTWSQDSLRTADRILDMTEMFLARSRRFPSDFWVRLSGIVEVLIAWVLS